MTAITIGTKVSLQWVGAANAVLGTVEAILDGATGPVAKVTCGPWFIKYFPVSQLQASVVSD